MPPKSGLLLGPAVPGCGPARVEEARSYVPFRSTAPARLAAPYRPPQTARRHRYGGNDFEFVAGPLAHDSGSTPPSEPTASSTAGVDTQSSRQQTVSVSVLPPISRPSWPQAAPWKHKTGSARCRGVARAGAHTPGRPLRKPDKGRDRTGVGRRCRRNIDPGSTGRPSACRNGPDVGVARATRGMESTHTANYSRAAD